MFSKSAAYYDAIYGFRDAEREATQVEALIRRHKRSDGNRLLDVGCGTGVHLPYWTRHHAVEGLDLDAGLLAVARERCPDLPLHQADMVDFELGRRFDVLVCLFSAIGYVKTLDRLRETLQTFSRHVVPGGVVVVEGWLTPDGWQEGHLHSLFVDRPELKIARMSISERNGRLSAFTFHYLVGTPTGIEHFTERHELGLFTPEEYQEAFRAAELDVTYDPTGLTGRGLYLGVRRWPEDGGFDDSVGFRNGGERGR